MDKTSRVAERMIKKAEGVDKTTYGIQTSQYIRPEKIAIEINQKLRKEKEEEVSLWKTLLEKARFDMPGASDARLSAIVYKQIEDIKHGKKEEPDPELTFKPDISISVQSKPPAPEKPKRRGFRGSN